MAAVEYGTCPVCGTVMLPVLDLSPCGHDAPPVRAPLTESGTVYSWTRVWLGDEPNGRLIVMADFLDGALRVTAPLDGAEIAIGDAVVLTAAEDVPYRLVNS
ncbi:MAG TPA: hypothetical protein VJ938_13940 [Acidimicrobiia bacterium]|nr:hypothetical protein [Acidimicrobiia bacterium]